MGAGVFIKKDGLFLFVLRDDFPDISYPGCWCVVGGGIEAGETPVEAARREAYEEVGIELGHCEFITELDVKASPGGALQDETYYYFLSETDQDVVELLEGQEFRWIALDDAAKLKLVPHLRKVIEKLTGG